VAIPPIAPYPMPGERELTPNQVHWRLDASRAALLVHDMQCYFVDFFPSGWPPVVDLLRNVQLIRATARRRGMPVIYTAQPGGMTTAQRGLLNDFWGAGMSADPAHQRIVPALEPGRDETVLTKWRYSAFARTDLEQLLRQRQRDQLVVCGVYAHVGCLMTACDAFTRDIQPFLVADATADFTPQDHRMALDYAARRCASVLSTAAVTAALEVGHLTGQATGPGHAATRTTG
jgi:trans-2,3-dihydro-3-hydroxyanthranilic acid synthase